MLRRSVLTALAIALLPLPALADRDHHRGRGWDRHDHRHAARHYSRPRTVVSFSFGAPVYARPYYRPYYPAAVYAPPPPPQLIYLNNTANDDNRYCREYQSVARVGGASRQTYGTACMQPDGSWEIVS